MTRPLELICLGRAAVDFYGEQIGGRLEDMQSFTKYLGGSSANLCAGVARLGLRSSMLTRVGNEHMGRFVREALAAFGADVSHVKTDPDRLTASVVLGIEGTGSYPHIFFRENCADMGVCVDDFDERYIASSGAVAVTGTHLSTERTRAAVEQAFRWAKKNGTKCVLDIDYRPVLWRLTAAGDGASRFVASDTVTASLQPLIPLCDLVVGTEEEIRIAGGSDDVLTAIRRIRSLTEAPIVIKRGATGCAIVPGAVPDDLDQALVVPGFPVEVLNVLGAGDAFLSGFLYGWLRGASLEESGRLGNACGALVVSRHACSPAMPSEAELREFMNRATPVRRPDLDPVIQHMHHATTVRRRPQGDLFVLAFDHRRQLEELVDDHGKPRAVIATFKKLIAAAVDRVAADPGVAGNLGMIVDSRHGTPVLEKLTHSRTWVARPIELPGSRPLKFEGTYNVASHIRSWPVSHVIKCLVFYHPDDPIELRYEQEHAVRELFDAAQALDRDVMLEIISPRHGKVEEDTTIRVLKRFYNIGIRPAWWKLEAQSAASWRAIGELIEERDPWCNGALLLGLDAPEESLQASFADAAQTPTCRGFAVGRSIFSAAANGWLRGVMNDEAAIADMASRYRRLIEFWLTHRNGGRAGRNQAAG
jgi:5-dehydro-2-deoxygluconokinase